MTIILWKNEELTFKENSDYFVIAILLMLTAAFSYGAIVTLNCTFDNSTPTTHRADVLGRRGSSGTVPIYYVELSEWGNQADFNKVLIGKKIYNSLAYRDEVIVHLKSGALGIDWFEIMPTTTK